jgi:hypothetical protein
MEADKENWRWTKRKNLEMNATDQVTKQPLIGTKKGRPKEENFSQETGLPRISKRNYHPQCTIL